MQRTFPPKLFESKLQMQAHHPKQGQGLSFCYINNIKIRKLTLLYYYHITLKPHPSFASFHSNFLYNKMIQFRILCCIHLIVMSFNPEQFLNLLLIFMTLTLGKITGQFCCKISLGLDLPDTSSWLDSDCAFLGRSITVMILFSHGILSDGIITVSVCPLTDDVHFDLLIKVKSPKLLHWQVFFLS